MIHNFAGSWTSSEEKVAMFFARHNMKTASKYTFTFFHLPSRTRTKLKNLKGIARFKTKRIYYKYYKSKKRLLPLREKIDKLESNTYIAVHHPKWLGVTVATKELFKNTLELKELSDPSEASTIAKLLCSKKPTTIYFSALAEGWIEVIKEIKKINNNIIIKVIWHGSNALLSEPYDFKVFYELLQAQKDNIVNQIAFVKKSMYEYYKQKGFNAYFLMNTINLKHKNELHSSKTKPNPSQPIKIGLYSSGNRWVKNAYNQLAAISLLPNYETDIVPKSEEIEQYANLLNINITGVSRHLPRESLLKRLELNDLNIYVTFTECAPLLPLESFELGIPCITGNNHHYWENTELEKYLIVDKTDNIIEINKKINYCLENKEKIMELYTNWKKEYDAQVKENNKNFFE
ncbi:MAG: hypothetical protein FWC68_05960 [Oscillospiraceae bacterium]|nr:hypothetical protein [Oscillospiraceae bacterium]